MKRNPRKPTRRKFLKTAAATATASTLPRWFTEEAEAAEPKDVPRAANERPALALVGCGGRGRGVAGQAAALGDIVAVCDVDDAHLALAKELWPKAAGYQDFRNVMQRGDVDAVICGTVDHWHTLVSIAAMRAGKDVYREKPLTLTVDEGITRTPTV